MFDAAQTLRRALTFTLAPLAAMAGGARIACGQSDASPPLPVLDSGAFHSRAISNPLFPLPPGAVFVLVSTSHGRTEVDSIEVTRRTKRINGVTAVVVRDRVLRGGRLQEDTYDWYAQDTAGAVWYLGEDTKAYEAGKKASAAGSWEAGVGGAQAGIIMEAHPRVGDAYRQEYGKGSAEDMARVVSIDDTVAVKAGRYTHCVTTEEWSPLEPGTRENKTYCPGVGVVLEQVTTGGKERNELLTAHLPE